MLVKQILFIISIFIIAIWIVEGLEKRGKRRFDAEISAQLVLIASWSVGLTMFLVIYL